MHKSRLAALVIDCQTDDLEPHVRFWSAALGYEADPAADTANGKYTEFKVPGDDMKVLLQKVQHPSRVHLDIETDDVDAEVARLEKLGAKRVEKVETWVVMEAPSGHRFCVVRQQREPFGPHLNRWED